MRRGTRQWRGHGRRRRGAASAPLRRRTVKQRNRAAAAEAGEAARIRGLGGKVLDEKGFKSNERNTRGGVELGFLSTTLNQSTALEYSGVKKGRGIVLEIDVGAIDCGADLKELSQYPGMYSVG